MAGPVLISTDLDRTLLFSPRAIRQLGGALPADPVETLVRTPGGQTAAELCLAARTALAALPGHVTMCLATSRTPARLARLTLPLRVHYSVAANGGVILADGTPDPDWAKAIRRELRRAAPAASVLALFATFTGRPWLERIAEPDDMCCLALVDRAALPGGQLAEIADGCERLGWRASLVGRKLYAFPAGFAKERAVAHVAGRLAQDRGASPLRLAAGDTEHDRLMLEAADLAWVPAGSELSARPSARFRVTMLPGHRAAAQITREWLEASASASCPPRRAG